jgi:hypothetical protein
MRKHSAVLVLLLGILVLGKVAHSCWAAWPLEKVVNRNPLIVVGKIEKIEVAQPRGNDRVYDTAFIKVRKVLKNNVKGANIKPGVLIPLSMPSVKNKTRMSTDLTYKQGTDGVWLLSYDKARKAFATGRPDELQPLAKEQKITNIIKSKRKS